MANQSIKNAFQTFWYHVVAKLNNYATTESLEAHINDKANPHEITLEQLGVNATAAELNHVSGVTSKVQEQLNNKADKEHSHNMADISNLDTTLNNVASAILTNSESIEQKSQVQIITSEESEILTTLKIHKLTQEEYEQEIASGNIDEAAIYLTPNKEIDLSDYTTKEYVDNAIAAIPVPDVSAQIEAHNTSSDAHEEIRETIIDLFEEINGEGLKSQVQIITWEADD